MAQNSAYLYFMNRVVEYYHKNRQVSILNVAEEGGTL